MAPMNRPDIDVVEDQIKDIIQGLYQVMVQVSQYDAVGGRPSREVIASELTTLSGSLQAVHRTAAAAAAASPPLSSSAGPSGTAQPLPSIPLELIQYVENGRNPDIYTREFVEAVRRGNQLMRGKMHTFSGFRDVLAGEMATALPELRADVEKVVAATTAPPYLPRPPASAGGAVSARGQPAAGLGIVKSEPQEQGGQEGMVGIEHASQQQQQPLQPLPHNAVARDAAAPGPA